MIFAVTIIEAGFRNLSICGAAISKMPKTITPRPLPLRL
jgi:hypothetical protein